MTLNKYSIKNKNNKIQTTIAKDIDYFVQINNRDFKIIERNKHFGLIYNPYPGELDDNYWSINVINI